MREDLTYITIPIYHTEIDKKVIIDKEAMMDDCEAQIDQIQLKLWEETNEH